MFDLENALSEWRKRAANTIPKEDLEEVEAHLQDAYEARLEGGLKPEEAFVLATHQLGDTRAIGRELIRESGSLLPEDDEPVSQKRALFWWIALPVLITALALTISECFVIYSNPLYKSQVTLELQPLAYGANIPIFDDKQAQQPAGNLDIKTEIEVIQSMKTLSKVIADLRFDSKWNVTSLIACKRLRDHLTVSQIDNTKMVRITYQDSDAYEVSQIANGIASAYQYRRIELFHKSNGNAAEVLHQQLEDQSNKVEEARLRMLDLGERYGIRGNELDVELATERLRQANAAILQAELTMISGNVAADQRLQQLKEIEESNKDSFMDLRRKTAEYDESENEYDLQSEMFRDMQETYAKTMIVLTMPITPMVIHEEAEVSTEPIGMNWALLGTNLFRNGWPLLLGSGLLGFWLGRRPLRSLRSGHRATVEEDILSWA